VKASPPTPIAVSDLQWARVGPLIAHFDAAAMADACGTRAVLSALLYQAVAGCPWNDLPPCYPSCQTVVATCQRWSELGLVRLLSAVLLVDLEENRADEHQSG
jgi:transposase